MPVVKALSALRHQQGQRKTAHETKRVRIIRTGPFEGPLPCALPNMLLFFFQIRTEKEKRKKESLNRSANLETEKGSLYHLRY